MNLLSGQERIELSECLKVKGITSSTPRLLILRELRHRFDHPSAEQIYQTLCYHLPTLSRTTVYNTLSLLERYGLIRCLPIQSHEMRYDHDLSGVIHFFCTRCQTIFDPPQQTECPQVKCQLPGFQIQQVQTFIKGLCLSCLNNKESKSA